MFTMKHDTGKVQSSNFGRLHKKIVTKKPYQLVMKELFGIPGIIFLISSIVSLISLAIFYLNNIQENIIATLSIMSLFSFVPLQIYLLWRLFVKEILWNEVFIYESGIYIKHTRGDIRLSFRDTIGIMNLRGDFDVGADIVSIRIFSKTLSPISIRFLSKDFAKLDEIFAIFLTKKLTKKNIEKANLYFGEYLVLENGLLCCKWARKKILPLSKVTAIKAVYDNPFRGKIQTDIHICSEQAELTIILPRRGMMNLGALFKIAQLVGAQLVFDKKP